MSFSYENWILGLVYITIGKLNLKTWQSQIFLGTLFLSSILIVYKHLKDKDNKD